MVFQELFDFAWSRASAGLYGWSTTGVYRGSKRAESTERCFIGALIPDNEYHPVLEYKKASNIWDEVPALNAIVPLWDSQGDLNRIGSHEVSDFVDALQRCHDKACMILDYQGELTPNAFREDSLRRLRNLAEAYELIIPQE